MNEMTPCDRCRVRSPGAGLRRLRTSPVRSGLVRSGVALLGLSILLTGCNIDWLNAFDSDDEASDEGTSPVTETDVPGLNVAVSDFDFSTSLNALADNIDDRVPYRSRTVNFQDLADDDGPDIRPTSVIFYYNANLVAPLIAADPRAGLDLPPAVLVYRDGGRQNDSSDDSDGFGFVSGGTTTTGTTGTGTSAFPSSGGSTLPGVNNGAPGTSGTTASTGFGNTGTPASGTNASSGFGDDRDLAAGGGAANAGAGTSPVNSGASASSNLGGTGIGTNTGTGTTVDNGRDNNDNTAQVGIAYNSADYLAERYDLGDADDALEAYEDDLSRLVANTAGNSVSLAGSAESIDVGEGIVRRTSNNDFNTTLAQLRQAIGNADNVTLIAEFDHRAAALSAGTMLTPNNDPARLLIVDARDIVSRLIDAGQTVAVDLPIRLLVRRAANGDVFVYHDSPAYLADRHDLNDIDDVRDDLDALFDRLIDPAVN